MHLRAKPWASAWLTEHSDIVIDQKQATEQIGKWQMLFDQKNPIHVEIGSGKGQFILGMALAHPEINYIGMEIQETAIAIAARKSFEQVGKLPNLRYIYGNGNGVETYFEKAEVAKLYLNFSDPWPKARHESRRLTYKSFLKSYEAILPEKGEVEFKTDNRHLFEYSMVSFVNYGMRWSTNDYSLDLHQDDEKVLGNIETEYEQKFMAKGQPIYKIKAHF
ncbi:MAG: tRNA (guanosine(46)-N7)-methyltransferase TrmB [Leuconostoc gelidum]|jgi:tRNA (guanine-N7-)-methyltransferase|uniref:tRNA (guanine-N(7)-)-methyltransferase n=1 Tax=Leuconostoc gelidum subsp. gelidum TaxID=1607839 RepID=A0AB35FWL5_LEUGE|nr:tRNA (guanosine(46)-N7)-methyltransferase TrmB [Leuconostoc gelidum]MBZ5964247.1 tRNA (guanosine(46)-N7)-methyltransferase TrmB [Leuconostoc gelidum subsp. gelidum]MBZ5975154.1 tRNA (guanosine(46)-N7)-methyltransferase TrmB [Leuconostoc gelidum subsp. gelidum]MBZ5976896.1 tRNA (guanosine(46)-N7)-methyltransferase TrmB [Leuconostoc gelidum subsp. gelidum]MBZ5978157.1 tRNA (guanosine(46)-N7)-methyltransferase TrmB [Leuconostoc gelidum subsp. gelidum]MBZ5986901.1 tRNA (guanosine(46)-N7)-methyl